MSPAPAIMPFASSLWTNADDRLGFEFLFEDRYVVVAGVKSPRNASPNSQAALSLIRMNRFLVCAVFCNKKADSLLRGLVGYKA